MATLDEIRAAALAIREDFSGGYRSSIPIEKDGEDGFGSFWEVARIALEAAERVRNSHSVTDREGNLIRKEAKRAYLEGYNAGLEEAARRLETANDETSRLCLIEALRGYKETHRDVGRMGDR